MKMVKSDKHVTLIKLFCTHYQINNVKNQFMRAVVISLEVASSRISITEQTVAN